LKKANDPAIHHFRYTDSRVMNANPAFRLPKHLFYLTKRRLRPF